jgi:hypothetical protein
MYDFMLADVARKEYAERIRRAEFGYRLAQLQTPKSSPVDNLLLGLSQWLIERGEQLRHRVEMRPELS